MKKLLSACVLASLISTNVAIADSTDFSDVTVRDMSLRKQLIDDGWRFRMVLDDNGDSVASDWSVIDLPHDWSVLSDFDKNVKAGNDGGYLPAGKGVYRKTLRINSTDDVNANTAIYLEGAYMDAEVSVNGQSVGKRPYGYSSVIYDITPQLHEGDNLIEVSVDNSAQKNCRWYSGSGIYRHVWLINTGDIAVEPWSVFVTTPEVSESASSVNLRLKAVNRSGKKEDVNVKASIVDASGKTISTINKNVLVPVGKTSDVELDFPKEKLALWSPDSPNLYTMTIELTSDGKVVDRMSETFGVRSIAFSANEGFLLNGRPVLINGGCVHHDNGLLGARSYDMAEARKVRLMKEAGFNAVRTSHNPPSPAFLDECDRQGLLVIDEAFDGWRESKTPHDYSNHIDKWWAADIESLVLRDRNHPSVICWSIGNEVIERKKIEVVTTAKKLADKCRELDPTRPVTSALAAWDSDWEIYDPLAAEHEIVGYNYMIHKSESDHQRVPERVMWQTESYPRDAFFNWTKVADNSYVIGDFVWTAIDYIGESGIGRHYYEGDVPGEHYHRDMWPWHGAHCGDIDLLGIRKPISHYREILYSPVNKVYLAVREPNGYEGEIRETQWGTYPTWESWNWPGHEGKPIDVEVISNYDKVRLYLNGTLIGEKPTTRAEGFRAVFTLPYTPGELVAKGVMSDGTEAAETVSLSTAGTPVALRIVADKTVLNADNQDLAYITVEVIDGKGRVVPNATNRITFALTGNGTIEATGSADIKDTEGYFHNERNAWKGRAGAVVKSMSKPGSVNLKVSSPGLKSAKLKLSSRE
ncbi:MAG: DUF4982 domain-containing protein [Muribaculum sp.]|nr:DUF4982 domain-containing protein [Muribaculum sp.]